MPALSLTPAQRAELRAAAHALKPVVLIGTDGLTDAVLNEIAVHLAAHELIKIRVAGDERDTRIAIYDQICDTLNAAPIQHIGKLLVIWKPQDAQQDMPAQPSSSRRAAPRIVRIVKQGDNPLRRPVAQKVKVLGNERVTAGGNIKRAKPRQTSVKRQRQTEK
jgi:putative YhbY family RNA-binding protein